MWRSGKSQTRVTTPAAKNERQDFKWAANFLMLREEECGEQIEGDGWIETKDSGHKAESLLGFKTASCTFCDKKGHLVEACWRKQKLIRSNKNKRNKDTVMKNEANVNEDGAVITTPFILIGVTDDKGNLVYKWLQTVVQLFAYLEHCHRQAVQNYLFPPVDFSLPVM